MKVQCNNINKTKEEIQLIKNKYVKGTKIELIKMYDLQAPSTKTIGIVEGVDDLGNILVKWDNGSSLSLVENVDEFIILESEEIKK